MADKLGTFILPPLHTLPCSVWVLRTFSLIIQVLFLQSQVFSTCMCPDQELTEVQKAWDEGLRDYPQTLDLSLSLQCFSLFFQYFVPTILATLASPDFQIYPSIQAHPSSHSTGWKLPQALRWDSYKESPHLVHIFQGSLSFVA